MHRTLDHLRKRFVTGYLWLAGCIWRCLPASVRSVPVFVLFGVHLHSLVLRFADRRQNHSTSFLRNRAELQLLGALAARAAHGSKMDIAVFACSKGAEVYSIA